MNKISIKINKTNWNMKQKKIEISDFPFVDFSQIKNFNFNC
jgi:hypothetical protein